MNGKSGAVPMHSHRNVDMDQTVSQTENQTSDRIRELVEEVIGESPVFLVDVQVRGNRGSRVVEIYVDSDDELDVDELARISREVEFLMDMEDLIAGKYNLNVSTPGLDNPLALPRQYKKNVGRPLRVHFSKPDGSGNTEVEGNLVAAGDDQIGIEVADGDVLEIPLENVIWAKVQLPW